MACPHTLANVAKVGDPQFLEFECNSKTRIPLSNDAVVIQLIKSKQLKEINGFQAKVKVAVMSIIISPITIQVTFLQERPDPLLISP